MLAKLQAAMLQIKENVIKAYVALQPTLTVLGNGMLWILNVLAKLSSQLGLIVGIAIGYKLSPIIRILAPFIKLILNVVLLPLRFLGML